MKIRIEKIELEIPREFIETISGGLLRLRSFDAETANRSVSVKQSLLFEVTKIGFNMLREALGKVDVTTEPKKDEPAQPAEPE